MEYSRSGSTQVIDVLKRNIPRQFGRPRWGRLTRASLGAVLACVACSGPGRYVWVQDLPPTAQTRSDLIQVGDTLAVRVFGQEALSGKSKVTPTGTIPLPLLGDVVVARQRPADLARALEARLKPYVNTPSVNVVIEEAPVTVSVMGEVHTPGVIQLDEPATMSQALARAGGLTQFAAESRIFVLRPDERGAVQRIRFSFDALAAGEPHAVRFQMKSGDVVVAE